MEIALERNALALVQRLVDGGADVNVTLARGETILGRLVQGHIKLGRFNSDPEQIAAVKFVLRAGADPNGVAEVWRNMTPSIAARGIEY